MQSFGLTRNNDTYGGVLHNGLPHGEGVWTTDAGVRCTGTFVDGTRRGRVRGEYPDGAVYEGEWFDEQRHGQGTHTDAQGSVYTGDWQEDFQHGKGRCTYHDGAIYDGDWTLDHRDGHGTQTDGGCEYVGEWNDDDMHGQGRSTYLDGTVYVGQWTLGRIHGAGVYTSADGSTYEGGFVDGVKYGTGKFTGADGVTYEGAFVNGEPHGIGTQRGRNGDFYSGDFSEGKMCGRGKLSIPSCKNERLPVDHEDWKGTVYVGAFHANAAHGLGVLTYANGSSLDGDFQLWRPTAGVLTETDNSRYAVTYSGDCGRALGKPGPCSKTPLCLDSDDERLTADGKRKAVDRVLTEHETRKRAALSAAIQSGT